MQESLATTKNLATTQKFASSMTQAQMALLAFFILLPLGWLLQPTINENLFFAINHSASQLFNADVWAHLTNIGDGLVVLCLGILYFAHRSNMLFKAIISAVLLAMSVRVLKLFFANPRPPAILDPETYIGIGPLHQGLSLPSGHTATAFLLATLICLHSRSRALALTVLGIATLAGLSRIAVGVHWPADVFFGAFVGIACALIGMRLCRALPQVLPIYLNVFNAAFALVAGLSLLTYSTGYNDFVGVQELLYILAACVVTQALWMFKILWFGRHAVRRTLLLLIERYPERYKLATRFIKFGMVGASGFIVDITIYTILHNGFGLPALWARGSSYWFSASWNWMLNRRFTFKEADKSLRRVQWAKYLGMCTVSFVPSQGTFYLLTTYSAFFAQYSQLALVAGVAAGMLFNFAGAHLFVFKTAPKAQAIGV